MPYNQLNGYLRPPQPIQFFPCSWIQKVHTRGDNTFFGIANGVCKTDRNKFSATCVPCAEDNGEVVLYLIVHLVVKSPKEMKGDITPPILNLTVSTETATYLLHETFWRIYLLVL